MSLSKNVKIHPVPRTTVIVTMDIDDEERRAEFRDYMLGELCAVERSDSTFDFNYRETEREWPEIFRSMEAMIDLEDDVIYIWDLAISRKGKLTLFQTRIG